MSASETWGCHTKQSVRRVPTFHSRFFCDVDTGLSNYTVLVPTRLQAEHLWREKEWHGEYLDWRGGCAELENQELCNFCSKPVTIFTWLYHDPTHRMNPHKQSSPLYVFFWVFPRHRHWSCTKLFSCKVRILDFRLSPCFEYCMYSFGYFPGVQLWFADVSEPSISSIFKGWM